MNETRKSLNIRSHQSGGVLPFVAISMILVVSIIALSVDIGYLFVARNELQNAADAAALGATRQLGEILGDLPPAAQGTYNVNTANEWTADDGDGVYYDYLTISKNAQVVALQNQAASEGISIDSADIQIGVWEPSDPDGNGDKFRQEAVRPTAVRVTARREAGNVSGNITNFFAGIFGIDSSPVNARATASLTGQSQAVEGELELPIGVSRKWFTGPPSDWCGDIIKFSPSTDPEACAGWTTYKYDPANDVKIRNILRPEEDAQHLDSPYNEINDFFEFINGDLSEGSFENLLGEYMREGVDVDRVYNPDAINQPLPVPIIDPSQRIPLCWDDANDRVVACDVSNLANQLRYPPCQGASGCIGPLRYAHEWKTTIIVYDSDDCTPSGSMPILGYADVTVFNVGFPSNKVVEARIECGIVGNEDDRGGGPDFGPLGKIPGLVE